MKTIYFFQTLNVTLPLSDGGGAFFCAIGKFSKLPYNTKTLREDRTAAEMGVYRLCDPPQAENPVAQDSLFSILPKGGIGT